jgi:Lipid A 3-O-deacylase (PagL)
MSSKIAVLFFFYQLSLYGQNTNFRANLLYGKVVKHTEKLSYTPLNTSKGFELSYEKIFDNQNWSAYFHNPTIGVKVSLLDFGDNAILGYGFGVLPYYKGKIFKNMHYEIGTGIGYVTKTYNSIDNISNNFVSSNLNNLTSVELGYSNLLGPNWNWNINLGIRHFSNGGSKLPNYGINFLNINAGVTYRFNTKQLPTEKKDSMCKLRKFGLEYYFHLSRNESIAFDGPKYPVFIHSIGLNWNHNLFSATKINIDFERHKWVEAFGLNNGNYKTIEEARSKSGRVAIALGQEYFFNNLSVLGHIGFYINNGADFVPSSFYEKLGIRYYFINTSKIPIKINIGVYMKAHKATAEYISLGLGIVY